MLLRPDQRVAYLLVVIVISLSMVATVATPAAAYPGPSAIPPMIAGLASGKAIGGGAAAVGSVSAAGGMAAAGPVVAIAAGAMYFSWQLWEGWQDITLRERTVDDDWPVTVGLVIHEVREYFVSGCGGWCRRIRFDATINAVAGGGHARVGIQCPPGTLQASQPSWGGGNWYRFNTGRTPDANGQVQLVDEAHYCSGHSLVPGQEILVAEQVGNLLEGGMHVRTRWECHFQSDLITSVTTHELVGPEFSEADLINGHSPGASPAECDIGAVQEIIVDLVQFDPATGSWVQLDVLGAQVAGGGGLDAFPDCLNGGCKLDVKPKPGGGQTTVHPEWISQPGREDDYECYFGPYLLPLAQCQVLTDAYADPTTNPDPHFTPTPTSVPDPWYPPLPELDPDGQPGPGPGPGPGTDPEPAPTAIPIPNAPPVPDTAPVGDPDRGPGPQEGETPADTGSCDEPGGLLDLFNVVRAIKCALVDLFVPSTAAITHVTTSTAGIMQKAPFSIFTQTYQWMVPLAGIGGAGGGGGCPNWTVSGPGFSENPACYPWFVSAMGAVRGLMFGAMVLGGAIPLVWAVWRGVWPIIKPIPASGGS